MDTVTSNDIVYVKASVLAKRYHYTTDYIGQLCRQLKVDAQLVGRAWYVNEDSLLVHKGDRYSSVRPIEILSKNKHEIVVPAVEPKVRVDVHPRLSKAAHRMFFMQSETESVAADKNWMSRSPVYSSDTTATQPPAAGVKVSLVNAATVVPEVVVREPEIDPEIVRVAIDFSSPKAIKLDFTDIPAVFMDGELVVESLDTEDEYVDVAPVLAEEIEVKVETIAPRPGVTLRYGGITPPRQHTAILMPTAVKFVAPAALAAPYNPNYTSRVAVSNIQKTNRVSPAPVFLILAAFVISGTLLALTGNIVSDGSTTNQTISFNMAAVFEVLGGVSFRR